MKLFDTSSTASINPQGLIQRAWIAYKGNTSWPQPGNGKYLQAVMIANRLKNNWALDSKVRWDSLFQIRTYGPVASDTLAYDLDSDVFYLSDWVYILRTDGNTDRFQVVHPEDRNRGLNAIGSVGSDDGEPVVYLSGTFAGGASNLTLNFQTPWAQANGADVGGTIQLGCYAMIPDMANPGDKVLVNDPEWLVLRLAAELARNDPAKEDQFPNLSAEANDLYSKMAKANQGNSYQQPNGPAYMQPNIGVTWQQ